MVVISHNMNQDKIVNAAAVSETILMMYNNLIIIIICNVSCNTEILEEKAVQPVPIPKPGQRLVSCRLRPF